MKISHVNYYNYHNVNSQKKIKNENLIRKNENNSPSFKATFWGTVAKGTAAGVAAGGAIGSQVGGTVDAGSLGTTLGFATLSGTTVGGIIGGVGGAITGAAKYFHDAKVEKLKLEKSVSEQTEKAEKLKAKEEALKKEIQMANIKQQAILEEKQKEIETQRKQIEILSRYDKKKIEEIDGIGLGKIAGYEGDKQSLNAAFIAPYKSSYENSSADYDVPNGILLYGLSGNGKTTLAKAITDELMATTNSNYYDLSSVSVSKLPEKLNEISEKAENDFDNEHKRTLVFIDEFDRFGLNDTRRGYNPETTGYLKNFLNDCAQKGITLIATTNNPQDLADPFVTNNRRFNVKTVIEPPTKDDVQKILNYYLNGLTSGEINYEESAKAIMHLAQQKEGKYSCSGIENIANLIKTRARKEKRLVTQNDINEVVRRSNPDINKKQLNKFNEDFEFMSGETYEEYLQKKN